MSQTFDFCISTHGTKVPQMPYWLHEIKYDGYRLRVERDGDRVRLAFLTSILAHCPKIVFGMLEVILRRDPISG
jgi:hypothetical protein